LPFRFFFWLSLPCSKRQDGSRVLRGGEGSGLKLLHAHSQKIIDIRTKMECITIFRIQFK